MVKQATLQRARAGDEQAFRELTDPYRRELQVHCYRMLGSLTDAEDMLQETLLAAWRGLDGFAERASVRSWLYRIATNQCLNARRAASRRVPAEPVPPFRPPEPTRRGEITWLQPYPDTLLDGISDSAPGPEARYQAIEAIELAFIAGMQRLPPRQAATLLLRDVLGFAAAEVASMLNTSQTAVKGTLQRARAALDQHRDQAGQPRPRGRGRPRNRPWLAASPTRTSPPTSAGWSRCSPTTPGCPCRQRRTSTMAPAPSGPSCRPASATAPSASCTWCLPGPTPSLPWPVT